MHVVVAPHTPIQRRLTDAINNFDVVVECLPHFLGHVVLVLSKDFPVRVADDCPGDIHVVELLRVDLTGVWSRTLRCNVLRSYLNLVVQEIV